jgi:tRNA threonylcarbamoyladenosine biosynthesis protein TsaB
VAQGLAWGLGCRLYPVDSLLVVAEDARGQLPVEQTEVDVVVLMDARMDEVYAGRYHWRADAWQVVAAPALYPLPLVQSLWAQGPLPVLAGSAWAAFGDRLGWPPNGQRVAQPQDRAAALLRLAVAAVAHGDGLHPAEAVPLYLRDKVAQTTAERDAIKARALAAVLP